MADDSGVGENNVDVDSRYHASEPGLTLEVCDWAVAPGTDHSFPLLYLPGIQPITNRRVGRGWYWSLSNGSQGIARSLSIIIVLFAGSQSFLPMSEGGTRQV